MSAVAQTSKEWRAPLNETALARLRLLLGHGIGLYADSADVRTHAGSIYLQVFTLIAPIADHVALAERGEAKFLQITTDWHQTRCSNFHTYVIETVERPSAAPEAVVPTHDDPHGFGRWPYVRFDAFSTVNPIERIEVYEAHHDETLLPTETEEAVEEVIVYDQFIRLHGLSGPVLTLSTGHGSILGAIEVRTDVTFDHEGSEVADRIDRRVVLQ